MNKRSASLICLKKYENSGEFQYADGLVT